MESFTQRVTIPQDRTLHIQVSLPDTVPPGDAQITVIVSPVRQVGNILDFAGALEGSPLSKVDAVEWQRAVRDEWER